MLPFLFVSSPSSAPRGVGKNVCSDSTWELIPSFPRFSNIAASFRLVPSCLLGKPALFHSIAFFCFPIFFHRRHRHSTLPLCSRFVFPLTRSLLVLFLKITFQLPESNSYPSAWEARFHSHTLKLVFSLAYIDFLSGIRSCFTRLMRIEKRLLATGRAYAQHTNWETCRPGLTILL